MTRATSYKWQFRARFRRRAFGWKSQPAVSRVAEAVSEIRKVARKDKLLGADGAVLFLEKVSPALEHVDSSSGALGTAVDNAIAWLVDIIAAAPADKKTRDDWLERLWNAYQDDEMTYLEQLGDCWGDLCLSKETASAWADRLIEASEMAWRPDRDSGGFFKGTAPCLSALLAAERRHELLDLLEIAPYKSWHYRQYGVSALVGLGKKAEAIRYAEASHGLNDSPIPIALACEEILLSSGLTDEAYERYGLVANTAGTYLAWFRAVAKKYPHKKPAEILGDLVAETPGEEGKWFAAAKDAKLFDEAIALANRTPCSPQTLTRAARDFEDERPEFALEAGMAALRWLVEGYGYEVKALDVSNAHAHTMNAAARLGLTDETRTRIHGLAKDSGGDGFVTSVLRHLLAGS